MFQFKQFTIHQDKCAMKVCTDSCVLGALANPENAKNILDIGTGTGLLSLMLAQKTDAPISAIEIDTDAFLQAQENINASPWANQISIFNIDINEFTETCQEKFDLIICNPPFYQNSLKSPKQTKNIAHHEGSLTHKQLINIVKKLLSDQGIFFVLLPPSEALSFEQNASKSKLFLNKSTSLFHNENKNIFRRIDSYSKSYEEASHKNLFIKTLLGEYTNEFIELLKVYYSIF